MPEAFLYTYSPEPPKKAAVIKQSCGIGDTDGFPAFDVDSDAYAAKDDSKWGFLITGGAEFHMPLTVFQVTADGVADKAGIRLGDIILEINEADASHLTLAEAHKIIEDSGKKVQFLVKGMDEESIDYEPGEERSIVLRVPKKMAPLEEFHPTPLLGSRCWHPIMWQDPPAPPKPKKKKTKVEIDEEGNEVVIELSEDESSEDEEEELPHHRIIRNIRRFFAEVGENHELRKTITENMLLALPSASREPDD